MTETATGSNKLKGLLPSNTVVGRINLSHRPFSVTVPFQRVCSNWSMPFGDSVHGIFRFGQGEIIDAQFPDVLMNMPYSTGIFYEDVAGIVIA